MRYREQRRHISRQTAGIDRKLWFGTLSVSDHLDKFADSSAINTIVPNTDYQTKGTIYIVSEHSTLKKYFYNSIFIPHICSFKISKTNSRVLIFKRTNEWIFVDPQYPLYVHMYIKSCKCIFLFYLNLTNIWLYYIFINSIKTFWKMHKLIEPVFKPWQWNINWPCLLSCGFFFSLGTQDQRVILRAEICYDMICYAINLINKAVKWTYSAPIW